MATKTNKNKFLRHGTQHYHSSPGVGAQESISRNIDSGASTGQDSEVRSGGGEMVRTPYFTGKLIAKSISDSLYDLVLGSVPLVRDANNPDTNWNTHYETSQTRVMTNRPPVEPKEGMAEGRGKRSKVKTPEKPSKLLSSELGVEKPMDTVGIEETMKVKRWREPSSSELRVSRFSPLQTTPEEMLKGQESDQIIK